jgi:hypothetical protein
MIHAKVPDVFFSFRSEQLRSQELGCRGRDFWVLDLASVLHEKALREQSENF